MQHEGKALPNSILRTLWRNGLALHSRLFGRRHYNRLVLEWVDGQPLLVLPQVFNPRLLRTGELLAKALDGHLIPGGATVLDMGTGSGIGAIFAARWASRVLAVDINPEAVRCASLNVLLHRLEDRIEVLQGDLFEPVRGQRFDVVLFNPPYYRGDPADHLDRAWRSPDVLERFAPGLLDHLAPGGHALVILSTDGDKPAFLGAFGAHGLRIDVVKEFDLINEIVTIYRLRDRPGGCDADPL